MVRATNPVVEGWSGVVRATNPVVEDWSGVVRATNTVVDGWSGGGTGYKSGGRRLVWR